MIQKPSPAEGPVGSGSNDTGWARPNRTGNGKAKVPVACDSLRNSYSALPEFQKTLSEQICTTNPNGILQHPILELFDSTDRLGGRPISGKEMEDAQAWLALGLVEEMKVMGPYFTWSNNQDDGHRIYSKLDRIFCNEAWVDMFPLASAFSQWEVVSDHSTLLIKQVEVRNLGIQPFRYFNMWASHHRFREIVLDSWTKPICSRGDFLSSNDSLVLAEREAYLDYRRHEKVYESFIRQKSKITWLRFGDDNTTFFHASLKKRKLSNRIVSYISAYGSVVDDYEQVIHHFLHHFQSYLGCSGRANGHIDMQSISYGPVLDMASQLDLIKPFTTHDVKMALSSIHPVKSPGPDGYGAGFFKVDQPSTAADFRPIACCTTIYKCISKMLCSRLAAILPSLINSNQGAFIKHRTLAYNVLIFQDLIKGYNRKNSSPRCAMKIDLSKAYDSIDWDFLENLLKALCFPSKFIRWIMICLRGTSYSLLLNGRIQGQFQGGKGLRQGDPISPLLFVIVMDYLTRMLIKASKDKGFRFHPMCKSLNLVNLCFANDLLNFCKANPQSVQILHSTLTEFSLTSGLSINHSKSRIYLGGLSVDVKEDVLSCRTQLIQSILMGIRNYWMNIFLLPQHMVRNIDRLCRNFLWGVKGTHNKFHLASWEFVCRPKAYGGLEFREGPAWNKTMIAKFFWAISFKQDQLWVKWVNTIYLKGVPIRDYKLKQDDSWYWRKLIKLSHLVSGTDLDAAIVHGQLRLGKLYTHFISGVKIEYGRTVWCKFSVPKHRFVLWQAVNNHLLTRDLLHSSHVNITSLSCPVCYQLNEFHSHLSLSAFSLRSSDRPLLSGWEM
ncbi:uncharacterized protein LOC133780132 [Humulus lupulus]|uniref:uncharacterized protein LOC133780132 n=1 Tax=Humulus lupulus TaxID=3486 RepID=UPI002B40DD04|nr:uncharacterized protein LOC133780132 [Humulus lupulus]